MTIAAIDVDPQRTFSPLCPEELPVPEGDQIASALNTQSQQADFRVLTKDAHPANAIWVVDSHEKMLQPLSHPNADLTWLLMLCRAPRGLRRSPACRQSQNMIM